DVIDRTGRDHDRPWLADFRKSVDVVERVRGLAQVHEEDVRARGDRQRLHRVAQPALVHFLGRPAVLYRHWAKHVRRGVVAYESREWVTQTGARLKRSVHH